jgi:DNA-binding CsgD family transcriptional regulator
MLKRHITFFILIILLIASKPLGAFVITGNIAGADKCYYPRVYLGAINDIGLLNSVSSNLIIAEAEIDSLGNFTINGDFLPADKRFYRLYLTKDAETNAYISIGQNENYVILILDNASAITIECRNICANFPDFTTTGMPESVALETIKAFEKNLMVNLQDSLISDSKISLLQNRMLKEYKAFADTSSQMLPALIPTMFVIKIEKYANNKAFLDRFLARLKKEMPQSVYTTQFEKILNEEIAKSGNGKSGEKNYLIWFVLAGAGLIISVVINLYLYNKLRAVTASTAPSETADYLSLLTIKEKQILLMVDDGLSNKEIAEKLNVEVSTIKSHVSRIYQKTNIKNRSQVAKIARLLR